MDDLSIIENIRFYRDAAGMSKDQMAAMLGIHRTTYYAIENGRTPIIRDVLYKIADILKIPVEQLILGNDYMLLSAKILEEKDSLKEKLDSMRDFYEKQVKNLMTENDLLMKLNDSQAERIKMYKGMVDMLKKKE